MIDTTSSLTDLTGKVAIVTGAARGIGEAIALRLADAGAAVVCCDILEPGATATADQISRAGGQAIGIGIDLTRADDIARLVEAAVTRFGRIDILVNNAGLRDSHTWDTLSEANWDRFMAVNLKAVFFLSQAVGKQMVTQGDGGAMVNITSTAVAVPVPWKIDYNAAKAGVLNMSRSLAKELGPHGIRVNSVGPGGTRSPGGSGAVSAHISAEDMKRMGDDFRSRLALPVDLLEPDDIARAVLFFSSDIARNVTGQTIYVDAGYTCG